MSRTRGRLPLAAVAAALLFPATSAVAVTHCKAKTLDDGTIVVSARDVVGTPTWGTRYGNEVTAFDNEATCIGAASASGCTLAAVGMPARTDEPATCVVYVADGGSQACSAWIKRCYPSSDPIPCQVLPTDDIWNTDVSALPPDTMSGTWVASIGNTAPLHPDFGKGPYHNQSIGIPYTVVSSAQPPVGTSFLYSDESDMGSYPIPFNVAVEGGGSHPSKGRGDAHVLIVQEGTCSLSEVYAAKRGSDGSWHGGSGAIFDLGSDALRTDTFTSADAAGLPILPGLVRYDEVAAGEIKHAIRFTAEVTQKAHVWPARHDASSNTDPNVPPMGIRVRLKNTVDISGFSAANQVILTALKKYGMMLADNGANWFISGAPDRRWDDDDLHQLTTLHGSDFEVVDVHSLMTDPNSGKAGP
ncbi:MAG TPA: hypothetical protein VGK20_00415 [Candidatus Binatia bacterium]|jgi:hypothetical protein